MFLTKLKSPQGIGPHFKNGPEHMTGKSPTPPRGCGSAPLCCVILTCLVNLHFTCLVSITWAPHTQLSLLTLDTWSAASICFPLSPPLIGQVEPGADPRAQFPHTLIGLSRLPRAGKLESLLCSDITNTLVSISGETVPEGGNLHIY